MYTTSKTNILLPSIPINLIAGMCIDNQLHAIRMESQLQESLISALHSTFIVNQEQVQIATSSNENIPLLLPPSKMDFPSSNTTNQRIPSVQETPVHQWQHCHLQGPHCYSTLAATGWPHPRWHYHPHLHSTILTYFVIVDHYSNFPQWRKLKTEPQDWLRGLRARVVYCTISQNVMYGILQNLTTSK